MLKFRCRLNLELVVSMKRYFLMMVMTFVTSIGFAQEDVAVDPRAMTLLDKAISAFETKKGVSATFSVETKNVRNNKSNIFEGTLLMKSEKFRLSLQGVETYFDGKIQCVVMEKEKEVTISQPQADELKEVNPILMMKSCKTDFKMRYLGVEKSDGVAVEKIELYPNNLDNKYSIITLLITKDNLQPKTMILKGKDGINTTFKIKKIEYPKAISDESFRYDNQKYKDFEVVDLR